MNNHPSFTSLQLKGIEPAWCVDGRPDFTMQKGPQMLGGSLLPVILKSIYYNKPIAITDLNILKTKHSLGAHRGEVHGHDTTGKSGCGFADSLQIIIKTAKDKKEIIFQRLKNLGINNIEQTYNKIANYDERNITLTGENLVSKVQNAGGIIENLKGEHKEEVAFVNLKPQVTFDTNGANKKGKQAFNLDLWAVLEQSKVLGIPEEFAKYASLILYIATEIVLVEDKGKLPLPVHINK